MKPHTKLQTSISLTLRRINLSTLSVNDLNDMAKFGHEKLYRIWIRVFFKEFYLNNPVDQFFLDNPTALTRVGHFFLIEKVILMTGLFISALLNPAMESP